MTLTGAVSLWGRGWKSDWRRLKRAGGVEAASVSEHVLRGHNGGPCGSSGSGGGFLSLLHSVGLGSSKLMGKRRGGAYVEEQRP